MDDVIRERRQDSLTAYRDMHAGRVADQNLNLKQITKTYKLKL